MWTPGTYGSRTACLLVVALACALGTPGLCCAQVQLPTEPNLLFYASDDKDAGNAVAELIRESGFAPVRVGGVDQSIRIEAFGDLHELGKLGRLVTAKETAALV